VPPHQSLAFGHAVGRGTAGADCKGAETTRWTREAKGDNSARICEPRWRCREAGGGGVSRVPGGRAMRAQARIAEHAARKFPRCQ
jgi:hypothetical protein